VTDKCYKSLCWVNYTGYQSGKGSHTKLLVYKCLHGLASTYQAAFYMSTSPLDQCHLRSAVTGQPTQPPILCETINKYQPKCGDALPMWTKVMMAHSTCRYRYVGRWLNCVIPHNTCHAYLSALEMSIAHDIERAL